VKAFLVASLLALVVGCGGSGMVRPASLDGSGGESSPSLAAADEARVVINSSLEIEVEVLRAAYERIVQLTRGLDGHVANAEIADDSRRSTALLRLRVPSHRHDELITALRNLDGARLRREMVSAREVTEEYSDLQAQLRNLQSTEAQYQSLLTQARSISEVLQVNERLQSVRGEIERAQGRLNLLSNQTELATINVTLFFASPAARGQLASPIEVLVDAFNVSLIVAHAILNVMVVLVVIGAWLIPLGLIGLLAWRLLQRWLPGFKLQSGGG
jgi:hypothetical protein